MIESIYILVSAMLFLVLVFPAVSALTAMLKSSKAVKAEGSDTDFGIIITCYKNIELAMPLVRSLDKQSYSSGKYHVYLVADDCQAEQMPVSRTGLTVLAPEKPLGSKIKSVDYALRTPERNHDYMIILDPDNLVEGDYLKEMNELCRAGYCAVQGRRTAKNLDTAYACLDAAGEIYYNFSQRRVPFMLGSSATIAGSGMAIKTTTLNEFCGLYGSHSGLIIAEDKMLQLFIVNKDQQIAYAPGAVVYDEKVSSGENAKRQRTRWLKSYFDFAGQALSGVFIKGNSYGSRYFGLMAAYPPVVVLAGLSVLTAAAGFAFLTPYVILPLSGMAIFVLNFLLGLKYEKADNRIFNALLKAPIFMAQQIAALTQLRLAKKSFMQTNNSKIIDIEQIKSTRVNL